MHWIACIIKFWNMKIQSEMKGIYISSFSYILAAGSLLLLPFRWIFSFLLCAAIHEAAHILCAVSMGIKIEKIQITAFGARICTQPMTSLQEFLCAMAGPVVGLAPLLVYRYLPEAALICLLLSAYNLLPIYSADGARMLRCVLESLVSYRRTSVIMRIVETGTVIICCVVCLSAAFWLKNSLLVLTTAVWVTLRIKMEIHLAKREKKKYNSFIKNQEVQT